MCARCLIAAEPLPQVHENRYGLHTHLLVRLGRGVACMTLGAARLVSLCPFPPKPILCRYFLAPQKREEGESVDAFASRVQDMIAKQVGPFW